MEWKKCRTRRWPDNQRDRVVLRPRMPPNLRQHQRRPVVVNTTVVGICTRPASWLLFCEFAFLCHSGGDGEDGVCMLGLGCSPLPLASPNQKRQAVQERQPTGQHEEQPERAHGDGSPLPCRSGILVPLPHSLNWLAAPGVNSSGSATATKRRGCRGRGGSDAAAYGRVPGQER